MSYEGNAIQLSEIEPGLYSMQFDLKGSSVNTFGAAVLSEFADVLDVLEKNSSLKGVMISSNKPSFIVGADITEFLPHFVESEEQVAKLSLEPNALFARFEDLKCPTVVAINGDALGGGFEFCLSCDYRVMSEQAKVGLPEVKLGIMPGWGGSVRLPRLIGIDNAIEWICAGSTKRPAAALKDGVVDAVVAKDDLADASLDILRKAASGEIDFKKARLQKVAPVKLVKIEKAMAFETSMAFVAGKAGPHYPAPVTAISAIQAHCSLERDEAIKVEAASFAKLAKSDVAAALVGIFLKDQLLKRRAKGMVKVASEVKRAAVLGAGIMGGGVAYQSASSGIPIIMKDINEAALHTGLQEADKLLLKQISRGRLDAQGMAAVLNQIQPSLSYGDFASVDLVVEAVVENPKIKQAVLAEVEQSLSDDAVLTSNTSTISIDTLASGLQRPENFCGMHFFNPVHIMPLVEVIRGAKSSDRAIATTVAYARAMGKTPIVVGDCPGFLVNRILFPYFGGFTALLGDGIDFKRIDKLMEKFGWPMGPAYLLDVVGIDTGHHAGEVMAAGFPDRMKHDSETAIDAMYKAERFGQKTGQGFYRYEIDRKGKPKKLPDESAYEVFAGTVTGKLELSDEQIIERMMIPLCLETVRCLEDDIVDTAAEADMGLVYGIGFPPFRGGALNYIDNIGLDAFCKLCASYESLGNAYKPTPRMLEMAKNGETFYPVAREPSKEVQS